MKLNVILPKKSSIVEYLQLHNLDLKNGTADEFAEAITHYFRLIIFTSNSFKSFDVKKYDRLVIKNINALEKGIKFFERRKHQKKNSEEDFQFELNYNSICRRLHKLTSNQLAEETLKYLEMNLIALKSIRSLNLIRTDKRLQRYCQVQVLADVYEYFTGIKVKGGRSIRNNFINLVDFIFEEQEINLDTINIINEGLKIRKEKPIITYFKDKTHKTLSGFDLCDISIRA
jgi:hypothetical protein